MKALGMIETYGFIGSVEAADVMLKCADVSLLGTEKVRGGLHYISITGDVGAVKTAVDAGAEAVRRLGKNCLRGAHVIPRPDEQLADLHHLVTKSTEKNNLVESISQPDSVSSGSSFQTESASQEENVIKPENLSQPDPVEPEKEELTLKQYKRKLDRTRASELRTMISENVRIEIAEDILQGLVRREMIALLLEDFKAQHK